MGGRSPARKVTVHNWSILQLITCPICCPQELSLWTTNELPIFHDCALSAACICHSYACFLYQELRASVFHWPQAGQFQCSHDVLLTVYNWCRVPPVGNARLMGVPILRTIHSLSILLTSNDIRSSIGNKLMFYAGFSKLLITVNITNHCH